MNKLVGTTVPLSLLMNKSGMKKCLSFSHPGTLDISSRLEFFNLNIHSFLPFGSDQSKSRSLHSFRKFPSKKDKVTPSILFLEVEDCMFTDTGSGTLNPGSETADPITEEDANSVAAVL